MVSQNTTSNTNSSPAPACAEVSFLIDAVADNRASPSERAFVEAHGDNCPSCASKLAFARAAHVAWARTSPAVPSLSLSARIAAATYRKPTFAERFASILALLQPVPVRVAIGACAAVGIGVLVAPRLHTPAPTQTVAIVEPVRKVTPAPAPTIAHVSPKAQPHTAPKHAAKVAIVVAKIEKPIPAARVPKHLVIPVEAPVVTEVKPQVAPVAAPRPAVLRVKPVAKPKPAALVAVKAHKPQPTQVAREYAHESRSAGLEPATEESRRETEVAVAEPMRVEPRIETSEPAAKPAQSQVLEDDRADTSGRLSRRLGNVGKKVAALSGSATFAAATTSVGIVSAQFDGGRH